MKFPMFSLCICIPVLIIEFYIFTYASVSATVEKKQNVIIDGTSGRAARDILKGIKATEFLLVGAELTRATRNEKWYIKNGGKSKAIMDYFSIIPANTVQLTDSKGEVIGQTGKIGGSHFILSGTGKGDGHPTITVYQGKTKLVINYNNVRVEVIDNGPLS